MTGLLSSQRITERLENDEIFAADTFKMANLRPASYDLRIATDLLRLPDLEGVAQVYERGNHFRRPIRLRPGDVIFVTSAEEFQMPADLAANIGVRFGLAGKGVLVHTGLLVHPNFGRDQSGTPVAPGQRLHFLLANLSPEDVFIQPNEKVASLQFFEVEGLVVNEAAGREDLEDKYIRDKEPLGLGYLSEVNIVAKNLGELKATVETLKSRFTLLERSSRDLIQFGVYIVAAAFLGVVFTEILGFLQSGDSEQVGKSLDELHLTWPDAVTAVAIAALVIFLLRWAVQGVGEALIRLLRFLRRRRETRRTDQKRKLELS